MCGIAGLAGDFRDVDQSLRRMVSALAHRGPDDEGFYVSQGIALGHRRLSIIDLSGGHQPIVDDKSGLVIVFNGEIYNYKSLRIDLERAGARFLTDTDTEIILRLYERHGRDCLGYLQGMFAFAIWDTKNQELFAARDHLGQKPLYYSEDPRGLAFASEIKGLLAYDPSLRELDLEALDQYFTMRVIAPPHSMFRGVRKLPPAHWLTYSRSAGLRIQRYWQPEFEPKNSDSEADILEELDQRLIESLQRHVVSDVPIGAFLSGGLDSTLVTAILMKHVADSPVPTFTLGLPHENYNEAPLARLVAEKYGTQHHERVEIPSLTKHLPDLVYHLDEPSDPLSICTYLVSEMAREHVKVVLGGDGGDELFGGYDRYYGNVYADHYSRIPEVIRRKLIGPILERFSGGRWYKSKLHQIKWLHSLSFTRGGLRYADSLSYFYFSGDLKQGLLGSAMREALCDYDPRAPIAGAYESARANEAIDRMLASDDQIRLPDHPVMITDRMTMAHGLEARSPLMDHKLVEFAARLPVRLKVRGRKLRYMQKRLAERYLPPELLHFPKQGFSSPLPYLLRDEYRRLFSVFLKRPQLAEAGILNCSAVETLLAQHLGGQADHGNRLWLLLNAEVWYRMFISSQSRDQIRATIMADA